MRKKLIRTIAANSQSRRHALIFYVPTDQPGTVAQEVAYVKEEGCLSDFEGRDGRRQELALPYKELYCISPIPSRDEEGEDR